MEKREPVLSMRDLAVSFQASFGKIRAVRGVNMDVYPGETVAIVGESGSGKSVTVKSIMGLLQQTQIDGEIFFEGQNILAMKEKELSKLRGRNISMIFQEPMTSLNPVYTVGTQISEMITAHEKVSKKEVRERAIELVRLVGITSPEKRVDEYPHELSGGMRERVMIAMALACNPKILIADDSAMNRAILTEMLGDGYEILEAENGRQAVAILQSATDIDLLLLDIMMPEMDGFEVLAMMNKYHWIDEVPVIMISAENASSYVERAYDLGATDYISRPFDCMVVRRRVVNALILAAKQKRLMRLAAEQIYEKEKNNQMMISILSHIMEFRNGESGLHVHHINVLTSMLLERLVQKTDRYHLSWSDQLMITTASALHDIGKMGIDENILNKPGRLTKEEFEEMKKHTLIGASMLKSLELYQDEKLVQIAYQICRWHHERYDGTGYPFGRKGNEISLPGRILAVIDVYDALTSERCYNKAFDHDTALHMILNGECGTFNPELLECFFQVEQELRCLYQTPKEEKEHG